MEGVDRRAGGQMKIMIGKRDDDAAAFGGINRNWPTRAF
jgi:hypothetical protein